MVHTVDSLRGGKKEESMEGGELLALEPFNSIEGTVKDSVQMCW